MVKFGMYGKIVAHAGKRDELVQVLMEAAENLESYEGCDLYIVNVSDEEPDTIWVTEVWKDAEAHQASLNLEAVKSLIQRGRPLIASMEPVRLQVVGGKGLR